MSGNAAPLVNFFLTSSGVFPGLHIVYAVIVFSLVVMLSIMINKDKKFTYTNNGKSKYNRYFYITVSLMTLLLVFAVLFFGLNVAMVDFIEEEKKNSGY